MIRVLIVDNHTLLRQGLQRILSEDPDVQVVAEAADAPTAIEKALALSPDVILMDVIMPDVDGIEATRQIRAVLPATRVLMLTVSDQDEDLFAALRAGARGYLLKNAEAHEVVEAIHRVHAGEAILPPSLAARVLDEFAATSPTNVDALTERELDVLCLIAKGLSNKEIAARLILSQNTVKTHVRHILEKLHMRNRVEAAAYAIHSGLIQED